MFRIHVCSAAAVVVGVVVVNYIIIVAYLVGDIDDMLNALIHSRPYI